jgi:hypothetical protein
MIIEALGFFEGWAAGLLLVNNYLLHKHGLNLKEFLIWKKYGVKA